MSSGSSQLKVLIVSPPYRLSAVCLPIGLAYIASAVCKAGYPVEVIDMDMKNYSPNEYSRILREKKFDVLLLGGMITAWNFLKTTCHYVKKIKPKVKIIVGGTIITSTPLSFLSVAPADVGVVGEGEDSILELLSAFGNERSLSEIPGIVYKDGHEIKQTAAGTLIEDLDRISFPAWDLFDVANTYSRFPSHNSLLKAKSRMAIITARGCPYQCTFCYSDKRVRFRSVANVLAEIEELVERYGIRHIDLLDDLFVAHKKRVLDFCNELIRKKLKITWSAAARCNLADYNLFQHMKSAGCQFLGLGIESGSPTVLKAIKKQQTPEQIINAVKLVRKAGIEPGGSFIMGLPGETPETVCETAEVYKAINQYRAVASPFFFATPYPGTELYAEVRRKNRIPCETEFFEKLSQKGDAVAFVINCTDAFTDEELVRAKAGVEREVFFDFFQKHPLIALRRFLEQRTLWGKVRAVLLRLKMHGFVNALHFLSIKLRVKFVWMDVPYERHWTKIREML